MSDQVLEEFIGSMTVSEFCARTGRSVEDLVEFCAGRGGSAPKGKATPALAAKASGKSSAKPTKSAKPSAKAAASGVETRTQAGRDAFDAALLDLLKGVQSGMGARDIADETGASLPQIRSAVARLVSKKKVRFEGKTAARRYWARG